MLILSEKQVQKCQLNIENKCYSGFLYMSRIYMMKNFQEEKDYKAAIQESRTLLNQKIHCIILEHSNGYTIWHLAPETAEMINPESQDNIQEIKCNLQAKVMQFRGISYLEKLYNLETSIQKVQQSLREGNKVKLLMQLEGNNQISSAVADKILDSVKEKLKHLANIEDKPQVQESQFSILLSPKSL